MGGRETHFVIVLPEVNRGTRSDDELAVLCRGDAAEVSSSRLENDLLAAARWEQEHRRRRDGIQARVATEPEAGDGFARVVANEAQHRVAHRGIHGDVEDNAVREADGGVRQVRRASEARHRHRLREAAPLEPHADDQRWHLRRRVDLVHVPHLQRRRHHVLVDADRHEQVPVADEGRVAHAVKIRHEACHGEIPLNQTDTSSWVPEN